MIGRRRWPCLTCRGSSASVAASVSASSTPSSSKASSSSVRAVARRPHSMSFSSSSPNGHLKACSGRAGARERARRRTIASRAILRSPSSAESLRAAPAGTGSNCCYTAAMRLANSEWRPESSPLFGLCDARGPARTIGTRVSIRLNASANRILAASESRALASTRASCGVIDSEDVERASGVPGRHHGVSAVPKHPGQGHPVDSSSSINRTIGAVRATVSLS